MTNTNSVGFLRCAFDPQSKVTYNSHGFRMLQEFLKNYLYFMCMGVLFMHRMYGWCQRKTEEAGRCPGTGITDGCELQTWVLASLQNQQKLHPLDNLSNLPHMYSSFPNADGVSPSRTSCVTLYSFKSTNDGDSGVIAFKQRDTIT